MESIKGLRIVVAEDDDLNLFIMQKILTDFGHSCAEFLDGDLAWNYLSQNSNNVDMVILDKMMPQMNGLDVVRKMKKNDILKNIPIVIQSGDAFPDKIQEAMDLGVDRYITKPFEDTNFLSIVQEVASEYGLRSPDE